MNDLPEFRLPTEPYPGLRPFLDHESSLLFGRARQVHEVIEHLRDTRFVAVIGGSGSGKSSLIHAGVVPELRSFGIPGAGDFWIPMVCTPGTNANTHASANAGTGPGTGPGAAHSAVPRYTPITRLAWKFARLLKPLASEAAESERVESIAALFRQDTGFARLADTYAEDLAVPPGPDPKEARLLFVIDQFEELFHPTNKGNDDARLMVERVIDHFFNPHPRCYVVLTMRSEHLNDCASYLELPDAINKSSYLVRRLDEDELREAIVAPAQRFLRMQQRLKTAALAALPAEVVFDPVVLERLLRDVKSITHDPDHLPLLQHLLARVWEMACRRENVGAGGVPAAISPADLWRAVLAANEGNAAADEPADDKLNVLRASLENWAEAIYRQRSPVQQKCLEALLKQLAFKDPNTGMYTQQRVDVDDPRLFGDGEGSGEATVPSTRAALWALIEDPQHGRSGQFGYVGSVDYLFWDDENRGRVTLKVSHESFIRGWSHFRLLIDKEAERFEEFVAVLRRCAEWASATSAKDRRLLEASDLLRLQDARLPRVLADLVERAAWFRVLLLDRDGARLARYEPQIDEFLRLSQVRQVAERQRQRDLEAREHSAQASRNFMRNALVGVAVFALPLVFVTLFSTLIQAPVRQSAELFFEARNLADQTPLPDSYPAVGSADSELATLVKAAGLIEQGYAGRKTWTGFNSRSFLRMTWAPGVQTHAVFLSQAAQVSEPGVNGPLRKLLSAAPWSSKLRPADLPAVAVIAPDTRSLDCAVPSPAGPPPGKTHGKLFLEAAAGDDPQPRGIFVPDGDPESDVALHPARLSGNDCIAGEAVWTVPRVLNPQILLDANVRYMAVAVDGRAGRGDPSVTIYQVLWGDRAGSTAFEAQMSSLMVLTGPAAVKAVRNELAAGTVASTEPASRIAAGVPTWREPGGFGFLVNGQGLRLVSESAQRLERRHDDAEWIEIKPAREGSACEILARMLNQGLARTRGQEQFATVSYEHDKLPNCFAVTRGIPQGARGAAPGSTPAAAAVTPTGAAATDAPQEHVLVAVYARPYERQLAATSPPAALASLAQFGRFAPGQGRWFVGAHGAALEGWIAMARPDATGALSRFDGAPWSTSALRKLGDGILPAAAGSSAAASATATAASAR
ncbi:MAG: hypothetical protein H7337_19630 [Rhizobacter sp.]|nr:hypothetical protein [Rhizobacter sp.]